MKAGLFGKERFESANLVSDYTVRFLRRIRQVLAPNGSSSNAPAIIVVGSGTGARLVGEDKTGRR